MKQCYIVDCEVSPEQLAIALNEAGIQVSVWHLSPADSLALNLIYTLTSTLEDRVKDIVSNEIDKRENPPRYH